MAVNDSHRPVWPASVHTSEDNLVSHVRNVNGYMAEGVYEINWEFYSRPWQVSRLEGDEWNFSWGRDIDDCCSSSESTYNDIVDRLPSDPFGMDLGTTFTAINRWLEDLEVDCGGYMWSNNGMPPQEGYGLSGGWNLIWNDSCKFQPFPCTIQMNERQSMSMLSSSSNLQVNERLNTRSNYFPSGFQFDQKLNAAHTMSIYEDCSVGNVGFSSGSISCSLDTLSKGGVGVASEYEGAPHEALNYVLNYLGVKDLLSVERVCSSLSYAVRSDPLYWKMIHIDQPLNERITNDALVQLAGRAQGNLECLSLVECTKITDDGLRRVLEANRRVTKLSVPGCTKINIECVVNCTRAYNNNNKFGGIKHVRIGKLYCVEHEHFKELKSLLSLSNKKNESYHKHNFFHRGNLFLPLDDDRAIDIETCPRCGKLGLVYDCPSEQCKAKNISPSCRACPICVPRCARCGRCSTNIDFFETFTLEDLCSDCYKHENKLDEKVKE